MSWQLPVGSWQKKIANCSLPTASYKLQTKNMGSWQKIKWQTVLLQTAHWQLQTKE
jgi:hypothetical protein